MTGYGRGTAEHGKTRATVDVRAVNHRYLELSLRLPDDLRCLEGDARTLLATNLRRGKVEAGIYLRSANTDAGALELNRPLVIELRQRAAEVAELLGGAPAAISAFDVLRWPGVVRDTDRDLAPVVTEAMALLADTVAELNESRARVGARLRDTLRQRCDALRARVATVRARLPEVRGRIQSRTAERAAQLGISVDSDRLEQEIALLACKMDVEEELDRLGSHVTEILQVFDSKEPAGRRLDFLMQELNREANTLSSKSQDVETTRAAVDIKVLIEQMREQVQNIE